jgi:uncharacterized protein YciI
MNFQVPNTSQQETNYQKAERERREREEKNHAEILEKTNQRLLVAGYNPDGSPAQRAVTCHACGTKVAVS